MSLPPADSAREGRYRLEEMKVELAWLADRATFPYLLAARAVDGSLEIRGSVPSLDLQVSVLRIAKAHSHLPVLNALEINGNAAEKETGLDQSAVRQGAVEILSDAFGMAARGFEIRADSDGIVAVSGSVNSVEEKLAVSRRLRKVRGCACVSNYLQISPVMRDGRMVTQINAAGSLVVPGQVLCLDGTGQDLPAPRAATAPPPGLPPVRKVVSIPKPVPVVVTAPATVPPRPAVQPASLQIQTSTVTPVPVATNPPAVMPIEVPVPPSPRAASVQTPVSTGSATVPAVMPRGMDKPSSVAAPATASVTNRTDAQPRVLMPPPPSYVTVHTDASMQNFIPLPLPATRPAVPLARDSSTAKTVSGPHSDKEVDLLAAPTVPESWLSDNTQTKSATKQKSQGPSNFAVTRPEPSHKMSNDELLALPAVPLTGKELPISAPAVTTLPPKPVVLWEKPAPQTIFAAPAPKSTNGSAVTAVTVQPKPATPAPVQQVAPSPVPKPLVVNVQSVPVTPAPVQQATHIPVLKPLAVPAPTAFKDTWVDAVPAPKVVETPGHPLPPPGGWPAAHISRPAPTAYVTSGLLVFPDEHAPAAKPAVVTAPANDHGVAPAPKVEVVSRIEPLSPATPVVTPTPAISTYAALSPGHGAPLSVSRLKQQVEQACGRLANHVEVTGSDKGITVRVKCVDATAAQKVTERVLVQVPEMMDAKVKFEVDVAK
jgi:hypothetical protein